MVSESERARLERLDRNAGAIGRARKVGWKAAYRHHEREERDKDAAELAKRVAAPQCGLNA